MFFEVRDLQNPPKNDSKTTSKTEHKIKLYFHDFRLVLGIIRELKATKNNLEFIIYLSYNISSFFRGTPPLNRRCTVSGRWRNTHFPEKECSRLDGVQNHDFPIQGIPINSEFHSLFNHFVNGDGHGVCNHTPTRDEHGGGYIYI